MDVFYIPWIANLVENEESADKKEFVIISNDLPNNKPRYRLTFLDGKGMAEISRLILAYVGEPFIDNRLSFKQWWSNIQDVSFQLVPILQFDDKVICQGTAIARYLAKIYGLAGKGIFEEAQVDSVIDVVKSFGDDIKRPFIVYFKKFEHFKVDFFDPEIHESIKKEIINLIKRYMPLLESACSNKYPHGFIFKSGLTFADFAVANIFELLENFYPESVESFKNVKCIKDRVFALPQLQSYLNQRPKSIL